jgi:prenyltransferase beta subunit
MIGLRSATAPRFEKYRRLRIAHALAAVGVVLLVALGPPSAFASPASRAASAKDAADWISSQQQSNGAFFATNQDVAGTGGTAETLAAAVAGGTDADSIAAALEYMEANGEAAATEAAFTGRIIAGVIAGGDDPSEFGGVDYVAILASQFDSSTGSYEDGAGTPYGDNLFADLIAANGQIAADGELPTEATEWIVSQQCTGADSGGFGFGKCQFGADVDTTALAINALVNSGSSTADVENAIAAARGFLLGQQNDDGGYPYCCGDVSSTDSTGLTLTAIAALEEDAEASPWQQPDGDGPVSFLESKQDSDGGFLTTSQFGSKEIATVNATPGMAGLSYPIQPREPDPATEPDPTPDPSDGTTEEDDDDVTVLSASESPRITLPDTGGDPRAGTAEGLLAVPIAVLAATAIGVGVRRHRWSKR